MLALREGLTFIFPCAAALSVALAFAVTLPLLLARLLARAISARPLTLPGCLALLAFALLLAGLLALLALLPLAASADTVLIDRYSGPTETCYGK